MRDGWYGVDLDGTLAVYDGWRSIEHIGKPVPEMLDRVKVWIEQGIEVRIFTARMCGPSWEVKIAERAIQDWCEKHGLPRLTVTNRKDFKMLVLYDDRCVQVVKNTGELVTRSPEGN